MKSIIVNSIFLIFLTAFCFEVKAQLKVGVAVGVGFPTGQLGSISKVGFAAEIAGEYLFLDKKFAAGFSASLTSFSFRNLADVGHTTLAPVSVFGKYYLSTEAVKPFIGLNIGGYYVKITDASNSYPAAQINLGLSPMGGFVFRISDQVNLNLTAKYHLIFSSTYPGASTLTFLAFYAGTSITFGR